jgi:integral membrane sensor domain MASE1
MDKRNRWSRVLVIVGLIVMLLGAGEESSSEARRALRHYRASQTISWVFIALSIFLGFQERRGADTWIPHWGPVLVLVWLLACYALYSSVQDAFSVHRESAWPWAAITIVIVYMAVERTGRYRSLTAPGQKIDKGA